MLVASIMMFHIVVTGFIAGNRRKYTFSDDFMERNFKEEHENAFP